MQKNEQNRSMGVRPVLLKVLAKEVFHKNFIARTFLAFVATFSLLDQMSLTDAAV